MIQQTFKPIIASAIAVSFAFSMISCDQKKDAKSQEQTATEENHDGHEEGSGTPVIQVPDYSNVSEEAKTQIKDLYQSYIALKNGLVDSDTEKAKSAAVELKEKAEKVNSDKLEGEAQSFVKNQITEVKGHAEKISAAAKVDGQREHLEKLSNNIYSLIKATGANSETAYFQYCPMAYDNKGAYWLSEKKEIQNPYFGESMLKCGENKETISKKM